MRNPLNKKSWSPYLVGVGIGVLSWFAFWSADHPLGITTAFEHTAALLIEATVPAMAETNNYMGPVAPTTVSQNRPPSLIVVELDRSHRIVESAK